MLKSLQFPLLGLLVLIPHLLLAAHIKEGIKTHPALDLDETFKEETQTEPAFVLDETLEEESQTEPSLVLDEALEEETQTEPSSEEVEKFKEGAEAFVTVKRSTNRMGKLEDKVEIIWYPLDMLINITDYNITAAELEMKPGGAKNWTTVDAPMKGHGRGNKWQFKVTPCKDYHFQIKISAMDITSEEALFEIPTVLKQLPYQDVLDSSYIPDAPAGIEAKVKAANAVLRWQPSDCADGYEVEYVETGTDGEPEYMSPDDETPNSITFDGLKQCTTYDTYIYAFLGDKVSDSYFSLATEPGLDVGYTLVVEKITGLNNVLLTWPTWRNVSCINEYAIRACDFDTGDCNEEKIYEKSVGSPYITGEITGLKECTTYTAQVRPVFNNLKMLSKQIFFRTNCTAKSLALDAKKKKKSCELKDTYLPGTLPGNRMPTFFAANDAYEACKDEKECGGLTFDRSMGKWTLRGSAVPKESATREISLVKDCLDVRGLPKYTIEAPLHCYSSKQKQYNNYKDAVKRCNKINSCAGIWDDKCSGNTFYTCRNEPDWAEISRSANASCIYRKNIAKPASTKKTLNGDTMVGDEPLVERLNKKNMNKGEPKNSCAPNCKTCTPLIDLATERWCLQQCNKTPSDCFKYSRYCECV